jgi:dihydrofolate reductase
MTIVSLVVAVARNGVIGRDGGLPWHSAADLKQFRALTMGKPVIMGRKTWESLPRRPLPGRRNIVITRQARYRADGAEVVADAAQAMARCADADEVCIIGGGEIYRLFWERANRIYLSRIDVEVAGDTFFPRLEPGEWTETHREGQGPGEGDTAGFTLSILNRNSGGPPP